MDSIVSWMILTMFVSYGLIKFFVAAINEKHSDRNWNIEVWGD